MDQDVYIVMTDYLETLSCPWKFCVGIYTDIYWVNKWLCGKKANSHFITWDYLLGHEISIAIGYTVNSKFHKTNLWKCWTMFNLCQLSHICLPNLMKKLEQILSTSFSKQRSKGFWQEKCYHTSVNRKMNCWFFLYFWAKRRILRFTANDTWSAKLSYFRGAFEYLKRVCSSM